METTLGQLLLNEMLPEDLRDYRRTLNKKEAQKLFQDIAEKYPDRYAEIASKMVLLGQSAAKSGNFSFSLRDFSPVEAKKKHIFQIKRLTDQIINAVELSPEDKRKRLHDLLQGRVGLVTKEILDEAVNKGNRLAEIVRAGSKGSPGQFNMTVGSALMFMDHKDRPIPIPILHSIAEGYDPAEYWASSYGTRKGSIGTKLAVQEAGYFGKKLALASHRMTVTDDDCGTINGVLVDGGDPENAGVIIQTAAGSLQRGDFIKPEHLPELKDKRVLVRSPITCEAEQGLCARCAGIRETGKLPALGDNIGISSAMVLGERLSQIMLSSKHKGGTIGAAKEYTFKDIARLFEMPQKSHLNATIARTNGVVRSVKQNPAGGFSVFINDNEHWVPSKESLSVKIGDHVEAGGVIMHGIPNAAELADFRGIGDARVEFMKKLREVTSGLVSRRNAEVISRAIINHVRVTDPKGMGAFLPGDVIRYDDAARKYKARENSEMTPIGSALDKYLESPALHFTIGTKITPRVIRELKDLKIAHVLTNKEPPSFIPDVQRMYAHSQMDPDWMTQLAGYDVKRSLLKSVHRGRITSERSTSYVPAVAKGVDLGKDTAKTGLY